MIDIVVQYLSNIGSSLLIIIITSLAGSYGKDYLRIIQSEELERVSLSHVLLSTFTATLIVYGLSDIIIAKFGEKFLAFASFVGGLVGFQLMEKLSTVDGLLGIINQILGLISQARGAGKPPSQQAPSINIYNENIDTHHGRKRH